MVPWEYLDRNKCCILPGRFGYFALLRSACWGKGHFHQNSECCAERTFSRNEKWQRKQNALLSCDVTQHGEDKFCLWNGHKNTKYSEDLSFFPDASGLHLATADSFCVPFLQYISALKGGGGFYLHVSIIMFGCCWARMELKSAVDRNLITVLGTKLF